MLAIVQDRRRRLAGRHRNDRRRDADLAITGISVVDAAETSGIGTEGHRQ